MMKMLTLALVALFAGADALRVGAGMAQPSTIRAVSPIMKGEQVSKFEAGKDFLFFQSPAPKTSVQEDLPSFFSPENFSDMEISPVQIAVTVTGLGAFVAVASVLL